MAGPDAARPSDSRLSVNEGADMDSPDMLKPHAIQGVVPFVRCDGAAGGGLVRTGLDGCSAV